MPSVADNNKYRCRNDGMIYSFESPAKMTPCKGCGLINYDQIIITQVCDFCGTTDPTPWVVPCEDFEVRVANFPTERKIGAWAACEPCKDLWEAGDIRGLAERSADQHIEREPQTRVIRDLLIEETSKLYALVQKHSTGDARLEVADDAA